MKKTALTSFFALLLTVVLASVASAKEIPEWFVEIQQDSLNQQSTFTTNQDNNYLFLHNNGESLDISKVSDFVDGDVDLKELDDFNVLGVSKYKANGVVYTDFIFSNLPKEQYSNILETALNNAIKTHNSDTVSNQLQATPYDYMDSHTFRVNDGSTLAGIYTSNAEYLYKGSGVLSGKNVSVWDVRYFNQSQPQNSYQTREIITRFSISDWANQTLRSYGPSTTPKNSSASVSLNGIVPTVSWNFDTYSSSVTDNSSLSGKYARWIFKPALGSNTAKSSYVMRPGARITNAVGQVGFKTTHNIDYYKNLNSQAIYNTGPITRYLNDR